MVQEAVARIKERYSNTPLVAVLGGSSQHSAREAYDLGVSVREAMAHIGGTSFTVGFPSWIVDFYRGVKDYARDTLNKAFGAALHGKVSEKGDGRDLFLLLLSEDFQESLRERVSLYRGLHQLNGNASLSYEIAGKTYRETVGDVLPELADVAVLYDGNELLAKCASRLLSAGKPVIPIITSGGASQLLAKCAKDQATPREVAQLTSYGLILEPEQRALVHGVYDIPRIGYGLANALGLSSASQPLLLDSLPSGDELFLSLAEVPPTLEVVKPTTAEAALPSADVRLADVITREVEEAVPDPNAALAHAIMRSILLHGKRDSK